MDKEVSDTAGSGCYLLNGTPQAWTWENLRAVCDRLGLGQGGFAVERNGEIVPRSQLADVMVQEGDVIEIVYMVGGG